MKKTSTIYSILDITRKNPGPQKNPNILKHLKLLEEDVLREIKKRKLNLKKIRKEIEDLRKEYDDDIMLISAKMERARVFSSTEAYLVHFYCFVEVAKEILL